MQRFAYGIVFLSQTSAVDSLSTTTWPGLILAMIGGSAGVAVIHKIIAEHLREKREDARRQADEDKVRRDAKSKAEVEQIEALTTMARNVPTQYEAIAQRFEAALSKIGETNALTARRIDENSASQLALRDEVHELKNELRSDTRALVTAIAGKLGVQTNADETNISRRASSPGQQHASLP